MKRVPIPTKYELEQEKKGIGKDIICAGVLMLISGITLILIATGILL